MDYTLMIEEVQDMITVCQTLAVFLIFTIGIVAGILLEREMIPWK